MSQIYIILEKTFEYNDETYDHRGSTPIKVFKTLEAANRERLKKEIEAFQNCEEPLDYYFREDIFDAEEINAALEAVGAPTLEWNDYCYEWPEHITDEELVVMVPHLINAGWGFYEVSELDMNDE